jgi:hypothetical protein
VRARTAVVTRSTKRKPQFGELATVIPLSNRLRPLPGDIVIERDNVTFYFPLMTCLLLSLLFGLVFLVVNR